VENARYLDAHSRVNLKVLLGGLLDLIPLHTPVRTYGQWIVADIVPCVIRSVSSSSKASNGGEANMEQLLTWVYHRGMDLERADASPSNAVELIEYVLSVDFRSMECGSKGGEDDTQRASKAAMVDAAHLQHHSPAFNMSMISPATMIRWTMAMSSLSLDDHGGGVGFLSQLRVLHMSLTDVMYLKNTHRANLSLEQFIRYGLSPRHDAAPAVVSTSAAVDPNWTSSFNRALAVRACMFAMIDRVIFPEMIVSEISNHVLPCAGRFSQSLDDVLLQYCLLQTSTNSAYGGLEGVNTQEKLVQIILRVRNALLRLKATVSLVRAAGYCEDISDAVRALATDAQQYWEGMSSEFGQRHLHAVAARARGKRQTSAANTTEDDTITLVQELKEAIALMELRRVLLRYTNIEISSVILNFNVADTNQARYLIEHICRLVHKVDAESNTQQGRLQYLDDLESISNAYSELNLVDIYTEFLQNLGTSCALKKEHRPHPHDDDETAAVAATSLAAAQGQDHADTVEEMIGVLGRLSCLEERVVVAEETVVYCVELTAAHHRHRPAEGAEDDSSKLMFEKAITSAEGLGLWLLSVAKAGSQETGDCGGGTLSLEEDGSDVHLRSIGPSIVRKIVRARKMFDEFGVFMPVDALRNDATAVHASSATAPPSPQPSGVLQGSFEDLLEFDVPEGDVFDEIFAAENREGIHGTNLVGDGSNQQASSMPLHDISNTGSAARSGGKKSPAESKVAGQPAGHDQGTKGHPSNAREARGDSAPRSSWWNNLNVKDYSRPELARFAELVGLNSNSYELDLALASLKSGDARSCLALLSNTYAGDVTTATAARSTAQSTPPPEDVTNTISCEGLFRFFGSKHDNTSESMFGKVRVLRSIALHLVEAGLGSAQRPLGEVAGANDLLFQDLPQLVASIFRVCITLCDATDLSCVTSLNALADLGRDIMIHCDQELYKQSSSSGSVPDASQGGSCGGLVPDVVGAQDAGVGDDDDDSMDDMSNLIVVKKKKRKNQNQDQKQKQASAQLEEDTTTRTAADGSAGVDSNRESNAPTASPQSPPHAAGRRGLSWCEKPFCGEDRWCKDSTFVLNKTEVLPIVLQMFSVKMKAVLSAPASSPATVATAAAATFSVEEHSEDLVEYLAIMNAQMLALRLCMIEDMLSDVPVDTEEDGPTDPAVFTIREENEHENENDHAYENEHMQYHHNVSHNSSQNDSYHQALANSMRVGKILSDLLGCHFSSKSQYVDHPLLLGYLLSLPQKDGFDIYKQALLRLETSIVTSSKTSMPVKVHYEKLCAIARLGVDVGVAWNEPSFVKKCVSLSENSWWFQKLAAVGIDFDHKLLMDSQNQCAGATGGGESGGRSSDSSFKYHPHAASENYAKGLIPKLLEQFTAGVANAAGPARLLRRNEFALLLDFCHHFHVHASVPAYLSIERCLLLSSIVADQNAGRGLSIDDVDKVISWACPLVPSGQLLRLIDSVLQQLDPSDYQRIHFVYTLVRRSGNDDDKSESAYTMIPNDRAVINDFCQLLHCLEEFHTTLCKNSAAAGLKASATTTAAGGNQIETSGSASAVVPVPKMNFFTLVQLGKLSVTSSPWDEINVHLQLLNEECRVMLRQMTSFSCVNVCPDELELRLLKESLSGLLSGDSKWEDDSQKWKGVFDRNVKPPLSRMTRGKFVMEALMWLKDLTSAEIWVVKLKLDAVDFTLDNMASLFPQKSAAVDNFRHVLHGERRKVATVWVLKNVASRDGSVFLYDVSPRLQELTTGSSKYEDGKSIIYELYYTYYSSENETDASVAPAVVSSATAVRIEQGISVHNAANQLCDIYNVNGPEVRQDIVHKWLLEEPLFLNDDQHGSNHHGATSQLSNTCFCESNAERREHFEQKMIARIINVLNYTEDVLVDNNPLDSVLDTPNTRGAKVASRLEMVAEKYSDRCKYLANVALQARSVKINWHARKRAIRVLFQYAPLHVIKGAVGECQFQSLKNGFWLECCYRALFEEMDLPQPSDDMNQSVIQGLVKSLWRDHRNDAAVVRVLSLVLLDFQVEEPQLWLSVLWNLLESGLARHLLFCVLEQVMSMSIHPPLLRTDLTWHPSFPLQLLRSATFSAHRTLQFFHSSFNFSPHFILSSTSSIPHCSMPSRILALNNF
jgi:hypothetical protein